MVAITITHRPELLKAGGGDKTYDLKTKKGRLGKFWGVEGRFSFRLSEIRYMSILIF